MRPSLGYMITGLLVALLWNCGCSPEAGERGQARDARMESADSIGESVREANDLTSEAFRHADSLLRTLPDERKAAMLLMPALYSRSDFMNMTRVDEYVRGMGVGGLVLLKGTLPSAAAIADTIASLATMGYESPFLAVDAENGLKMRFTDAPEFPWSRELGRLTDDQVMYEFGRELARECRLVGINMVLGPVIDVIPGAGSHGLMRKRSLGSDPKRVAELAIAYSRGVEDGNVLTVAKHFPGHGSAGSDTHKSLGIVRSGREALDSIDLFPFRRYVEEGLSGIMVGHLSVAALDSIRRPAAISPAVMRGVLRGELGFRGLIITDALNMQGAMGASAWQAIKAGADMVIAPGNTEKEIKGIIDALADGRLTRDELNDRCRRILFYKYLLAAPPRKKMTPEELIIKVHQYAPAINAAVRQNCN